MIGFNLTEEQKEMQAFYRKFSQERVKAAADSIELRSGTGSGQDK